MPYQFANAEATASLARIAGKPEVAKKYIRRAGHCAKRRLTNSGIPTSNTSPTSINDLPYVKAGSHTAPNYAIAWQYTLDSSELAGPHDLRTVEPSYSR